MASCSLESLVDSHHLTEEDIDKQITDKHMEDISLSQCGKWRSLPAHLELVSIVVKDIDRCNAEEEEKRRKFFTTWKGEQGSRATYKRLIGALLRTKCRQDAEFICKLLKDTGSNSDPKHQQLSDDSVEALNSTGMHVHGIRTSSGVVLKTTWAHEMGHFALAG